MAYVRGHTRANGSYVRPHHRRTPAATQAAVRPAANPRIDASSQARRPDRTTRVRGHVRANGSYVRPYDRRISGPGVSGCQRGWRSADPPSRTGLPQRWRFWIRGCSRRSADESHHLPGHTDQWPLIEVMNLGASSKGTSLPLARRGYEAPAAWGTDGFFGTSSVPRTPIAGEARLMP
jgi:hypothetical protein